MKVAVIIGHQKSSQGAVAINGESEWSYNSRVASKLSSLVKPEMKLNLLVMAPDVPHYKKPKLVNSENPDIAIELHFNSAANESATGSEVLYWKTSKKGILLAGALQKNIVQKLGLRDRGVKSICSKEERGGTILASTDCPCVIAEPFFGSCKGDAAACMSESGIAKYAEALLSSILEYSKL